MLNLGVYSNYFANINVVVLPVADEPIYEGVEM